MLKAAIGIMVNGIFINQQRKLLKEEVHKQIVQHLGDILENKYTQWAV